MKETPKFAVVGVGPVGSIMAAHLGKAGHDVTLVDILKDHMDEIKRNGLSITHLIELNVRFAADKICYSIDELEGRRFDIIIISVKASILPKILDALRKVSTPGTIYISLQNGLDTEELVAETFGKENTLRIVVNYAGNLVANGKISMSFFNPPNYIGMIDPAAEEKAKRIATLITEAGFETEFTSEIKKYEWEKVILNAALSPVCALTKRTMKQMMDFGETRKIATELLREGIAVAAANGILYEPGFLETCLKYLDNAGHHKTSMHVDLDNRSPTEIDYINGKIVEHGKIKGVPTPYNSEIVALIKGAELPPHEK
jgi:2-dehydropantoate 2-reductase